MLDRLAQALTEANLVLEATGTAAGVAALGQLTDAAYIGLTARAERFAAWLADVLTDAGLVRRIQPMVATLILMIAGRGIAQLITNSTKIIIFNDAFAYIGNGFIVLPFSLFVVTALFLGSWLLTRRTALGLFVESVGISSRSSFYSGINEKRVKMFAYVFCAFCAGIARPTCLRSTRDKLSRSLIRSCMRSAARR